MVLWQMFFIPDRHEEDVENQPKLVDVFTIELFGNEEILLGEPVEVKGQREPINWYEGSNYYGTTSYNPTGYNGMFGYNSIFSPPVATIEGKIKPDQITLQFAPTESLLDKFGVMEGKLAHFPLLKVRKYNSFGKVSVSWTYRNSYIVSVQCDLPADYFTQPVLSVTLNCMP